MATAVLHPQDYLAGPHNDRNRQFFGVSEYPSPLGRPSGRGSSATRDPAISPTAARDVAKGSATSGILRCRSSSAGLLPLPKQMWQNNPNYSRLAPKISASGCGGSATSYGSKHFTSSHQSNAFFASEMCISRRRSSVVMLDQATRAHGSFSECFPSHGVQFHERKPLRLDARYFFDSVQGKCTSASLFCAEGHVTSCQKLKSVANPHFSEKANSVHLKRAESVDQNIHYGKRLYAESCQSEVQLGRQFGKPPLKAMPDAQAKPTCRTMSTVGRKFGVNKQLKRSASERLQETPILHIPGTKEATRTLTTRLSGGVVGMSGACSSSTIEVKLAPAAAEGISRSCSSILENDEMWMSVMNDERWAGPSFINSPSPSALPVPSFTFVLSRTGSERAKTADCGTHMMPGEVSHEAKHARDITFATNDLKRMLHLDQASCAM